MVRKVRSDKKREVKPTINIELKDALYRISYITYTPVKDVCEQLCILVMKDAKVIEHLSKYFQRNLHYGSTIYIGSALNPAIEKRLKGRCERVTIKFKQNAYDYIANLAFSLDVSESRTVALLLDIACRNVKYTNQYMRKYLDGELSEMQVRELQTLLKFVNKTNDAHHSWVSLLTYIVEEVNAPINRIRDAVREFLNKED